MPATEMTKDKLEQIIGGQIKSQLKGMGLDSDNMSDQFKGMMKEAIEESLKDVQPTKPGFFDKNPREDPKGGYNAEWEFYYDVYKAGEGFVRPPERLKNWLDKANKIIEEDGAHFKAAGTPAQSASSLETGGALIPPSFSNIALAKAEERSDVMQKAMVVPMATDVLSIPYLDTFDKSQGLSAGNVKFRWVSENEQDTGNVVKFKNVTLTLREATALVFVSRRMLDFSPISIQPFVTKGVESALDTLLGDVFINGTGAGQPKGVMNASEVLITITKETDQAANTLVTENITKIFAQHFGRKGQYYANSDIMPQLAVLSVDVGSGGSSVGILRDQNIAGVPSQTLLGRPIVWTEYMQILGDTGDIGLFDWTQYLIGQLAGRGGMIVEQSPHLKFDFRQNAFQFVIYIDGQPWWPESYKPFKGNPKSPFVVVAARD